MNNILIKGVLGLSLVVGFTGCGQSDEEKIKELIKKGKPITTIGWKNPSIRINNLDQYCPRILNVETYDPKALQNDLTTLFDKYSMDDHYFVRNEQESMFSKYNCNYDIYKK